MRAAQRKISKRTVELLRIKLWWELLFPMKMATMNSDTEILVDEILAKSGAVEKCPVCGNFMIATEDGDAEKMAYGTLD
jgi:hypothetical protein